MAIKCAYCEKHLNNFNSYKFHLKVFHNKQTHGDKLLCGQSDCIMDFHSFFNLKSHTEKAHGCVSTLENHCTVNACDLVDSPNSADDVSNLPCPVSEPEPGVSPLSIVHNSIDEQGVLHDAALFVARLRSNPKIPLIAVNDIIQCCQEL